METKLEQKPLPYAKVTEKIEQTKFRLPFLKLEVKNHVMKN